MRKVPNSSNKQREQTERKKIVSGSSATRSAGKSSRNLLIKDKSSSTLLKPKEPTIQFKHLDGDSVLNILDYYGGYFEKEASTYQLFTQKKFMKKYYGRLKNGNVIFLFRNATINLSSIKLREEVVSFLAGVLRAKNRIEGIYRDQFYEYICLKSSDSEKFKITSLLLKKLGDHCKKIEYVDWPFLQSDQVIKLLNYIPNITKLRWRGPLTPELISKVALGLEFLECSCYFESSLKEGVLEQFEKLHELTISTDDTSSLFKSFNNMPNLRLVTLNMGLYHLPTWDDFSLLNNSTIDLIRIRVTTRDHRSVSICKKNVENIPQWKLTHCEIKEGDYNIFYESNGSFYCTFDLVHISRVQ